MRLHRLTGLERDKIIAEYNDILALIQRLKEILASEVEILNIIKQELLDVRKQFANPRRTEIIAKSGEFSLEDLIVEEDMVVTVSHSGYIKRNAVSLYRAQRRGGKGKTGMRPKEEDFVELLFIASTHAYVLIFTDLGKVYWLKVHEIPQGGRASRGKAIVNLLQLSPNENRTSRGVRGMMLENEDCIIGMEVVSETTAATLVTVTENGYGKRTNLDEYRIQSRGGKGIITIKTTERNGNVVDIKLVNEESDLMFITDRGKVLRTGVAKLSVIGRNTMGVRLMVLEGGERIVAVAKLAEKDEEHGDSEAEEETFEGGDESPEETL
ncbi:MAG: DNA gyrase C-terminal beta-propeller domain-containing protein [Desulfuromonadaceae bacterium]